MAEASASSWRRRAGAGRSLAAFADVPEVAPVLVRLLLEDQDTAVTRETARALAEAGTPAASRIVAQGLAAAGDSRADWIETGLRDALADDAPR
ncbi:HEAT repeat domain-containing protein [Streptomyces albidoflavus]|uniref:HEAT repeat domain-containing protein n=1 Tax=Streptomyces albidoflavus TaxID=1886 RepID=UPI0033A9D8CA